MYKVCYSVKTGRGAGNDRYTWLDTNDEAEAKRIIEKREGCEVTIYWISREP